MSSCCLTMSSVVVDCEIGLVQGPRRRSFDLDVVTTMERSASVARATEGPTTPQACSSSTLASSVARCGQNRGATMAEMTIFYGNTKDAGCYGAPQSSCDDSWPDREAATPPETAPNPEGTTLEGFGAGRATREPVGGAAASSQFRSVRHGYLVVARLFWAWLAIASPLGLTPTGNFDRVCSDEG